MFVYHSYGNALELIGNDVFESLFNENTVEIMKNGFMTNVVLPSVTLSIHLVDPIPSEVWGQGHKM